MLPSGNRHIFGYIGTGGANTQARQSWQWQPTLTTHDPNPPIPLEDTPPSDGQPMMKRWGGIVHLPSYNKNQGGLVW